MADDIISLFIGLLIFNGFMFGLMALLNEDDTAEMFGYLLILVIGTMAFYLMIIKAMEIFGWW